MAAPTAENIRAWSLVDFVGLGFPVADPDPLQRVVNVATAQLTRWTGQSWDVDSNLYSDLDPAKGTEALAADAVQSIVEVMAFRKQEDRAETLGDFDLLSSFSAGGYSESRRSGKDQREASLAALEAMFWPLMTFDKQDEWRYFMSGVAAPAFEVESTDWGTTSIIDPVISHGGYLGDYRDY